MKRPSNVETLLWRKAENWSEEQASTMKELSKLSTQELLAGILVSLGQLHVQNNAIAANLEALADIVYELASKPVSVEGRVSIANDVSDPLLVKIRR